MRVISVKMKRRKRSSGRFPPPPSLPPHPLNADLTTVTCAVVLIGLALMDDNRTTSTAAGKEIFSRHREQPQVPTQSQPQATQDDGSQSANQTQHLAVPT